MQAEFTNLSFQLQIGQPKDKADIKNLGNDLVLYAMKPNDQSSFIATSLYLSSPDAQRIYPKAW